MSCFDATTPKKDSCAHSTPVNHSSVARLEAKEFINAISIYPLNLEFSLWNLQGDWGMRLSCKRRGKVPDELEFEHEIELAKELGWLEEKDEDVTEQHQRPIRYGRQFVRMARNREIQRQTKRFIELLIDRTTPKEGSSMRPPS